MVEQITGFLPTTDEEWFNALHTLVGDAALRPKMGQAGRRHVEQNFALPSYSRRYADLLEEVVSS